MPAGTAHADDQCGLSLLHIEGEQKAHQVLQVLHEVPGLLVSEYEVPHTVVQSGLVPQLGDIIGIGQESHVKDQIGLDGDAVFKAEGNHGHAHGRRSVPLSKEAEHLPAQFCGGECGRVHDVFRPLADGLQSRPLHADRLCQGAAVFRQGVYPAGLLVPLYNGLQRGLHEEDLVVAAHFVELVQSGKQAVEGLSAPDVRDQRHPVILTLARHAELGKLGDERRRHVVHHIVSHILQEGGRLTLPGAGKAGNQNKFHLLSPLHAPQCRTHA